MKVMPNFPDPTLLAVPAFILLVALEWWGVHKKRLQGTYAVSYTHLTLPTTPYV